MTWLIDCIHFFPNDVETFPGWDDGCKPSNRGDGVERVCWEQRVLPVITLKEQQERSAIEACWMGNTC